MSRFHESSELSHLGSYLFDALWHLGRVFSRLPEGDASDQGNRRAVALVNLHLSTCLLWIKRRKFDLTQLLHDSASVRAVARAHLEKTAVEDNDLDER